MNKWVSHRCADYHPSSKLSDCRVHLREDAETISHQLECISAGESDAAHDMLVNFIITMQTYKNTHLFPRWDTEKGSETTTSGPPPSVMHQHAEAVSRWKELAGDLEACAERIWRDYFKQDKSDEDSRARLIEWKSLPVPSSKAKDTAEGHLLSGTPDFYERMLQTGDSDANARALNARRRLQEVTNYSRSLLLLWVEAKFYSMRMESNYRFYAMSERVEAEDVLEHSYRTAQAFRDILDEYRVRIRGWDKELSRKVGIRPFSTLPGEAQRLKTLSTIFGPQHVLMEELGWLAQASLASRELRYQYFDSLLRERWRAVQKWPSALWFLLLKLTTGFGLRPMRFAIVSSVTVLLFTALFFLSDARADSKCQHYPTTLTWPGIVPSILGHLYVAATNLTGLGSSPVPCGLGFQSIQVFETLIGYFLLATLAALLLQQVIDVDS